MAPSPEISYSADNFVACSICRYMGTDSLAMVCHYADRVLGFTLCDEEVMTMITLKFIVAELIRGFSDTLIKNFRKMFW